MADDEAFMEEDVGAAQDTEAGQRVGFLPAVAIKVLKWAAIGVGAIVFVVTVVIFTTRIMGRGGTSQTQPSVSPEYATISPELESYDNFDDIRTRTADETPYTVIARVALGLRPGAKDLRLELTNRKWQLQDLIRGFFSKKNASDLGSRHEDLLKVELKESINAVLSDGKVDEVWFLEFNVIPL